MLQTVLQASQDSVDRIHRLETVHRPTRRTRSEATHVAALRTPDLRMLTSPTLVVFSLEPANRADPDANRLLAGRAAARERARDEGSSGWTTPATSASTPCSGAQDPASTVPEERVFMVVHQLCELVFRQMTFDLGHRRRDDGAAAAPGRRPSGARARRRRRGRCGVGRVSVLATCNNGSEPDQARRTRASSHR